ncbi:cytochrome P450 [Suillus clintonianus]|uniref:cytochrome P450 n=1 Tax=Suillus clintonianus TaxID=1904413 RepID=UPI001B86F782|nr:cytochrome P450 [Suillus clintonianus]KAG2137977.1 cytochrome P450 [Suillus clintonianus]
MLQLSDLSFSENVRRILGAAACLWVVQVIVRASLPKSKSGLPLPPSPPSRRLRGHFLPPRSSFLTIGRWIDEHGPLVTLRSGTQKMVIIGRHKAAIDIMERQSASLVDRPRLIAASEMLSGGLSIVFTPAGDRFRRMRRALHTHLQPKAAEAYQPLQMSYAKHTVLSILEDPQNFQNHARTYAATTVTKIAYGKDTSTSATDAEVKDAREFLDIFRVAVRPGAYLVDAIPWLRYLPWYGQELKRGFEISKRLYTNQLNCVKEQITQGNADIGPSFGRYMLENRDLCGLTEPEMAFLAGAFFVAGTDTTALAICTVLMAAACFPDEQAIVQAELDAVIGRHRAPTFADEQSLPRLHAFISEALRWRPLVPNGTPHRTTKEVIWENYSIPAGTTVFGNHWAISRDPEVYPEPDAFKPQRWINDQGGLRDDLDFFVFGFGRRICPALHLAKRSVFINSALIVWAFELAADHTKPLDDMGFMSGMPPKEDPCTINFKTRIPELELRHTMHNYAREDH